MMARIIAIFTGMFIIVSCGSSGNQKQHEANNLPGSNDETQGVVIHTNPDSIHKVIASGDVVVIDVRPAEKYQEGHIPGAVHIDLMYDFEDKIKHLDARKVVVYCGDGRRSLKASEILKKYGIDTIFNLKDGFPTWVEAGYPVEKPE